MPTISEALGIPETTDEQDDKLDGVLKDALFRGKYNEVSGIILDILKSADVPDTPDTRMAATRVWVFVTALYDIKDTFSRVVGTKGGD